MRYHRIAALSIVGALVATACDNQELTSPDSLLVEQTALMKSGANRISVMTRNMYVGADVDAVIFALATPDPGDDFAALMQAVQTLDSTYYPTRAAAIADEIAFHRPHAVGLQEISEIKIYFPVIPGLIENEIDIEIPFLPVLQAELASRGLNYVLPKDPSGLDSALVKNIEASPALPIPGVVSLVDYDVMLVDADRVTVNSAHGQTFDANLGPFAPGVVLVRGWVEFEGVIDGETYRIASTHPESGHFDPALSGLRALQVQELLDSIGGAPKAIVMGDLNDWPGTMMYQVFESYGFTDVWAELRPGTDGYTCCHAYNLSDPVPQFYERIDYIWSRGIGHPVSGLRGKVTRTGMVPSDRLDGPYYRIWASDHAGLVASLLLPGLPAN